MRVLPTEPTPSFPYRVLGLVGEGAMGQVFRAEDIELGREVAIKVMKPDFVASLNERDAQDAMNRFVQEARAAAVLSHPGVTVVHRVGTEGGWPYIAMEWLDGRNLEDILAEHERLTLELAARMGLQVLSALDAAHRAGIVHRDIKPANLVLTKDRRMKIADFGVARVQGSSLAHTQLGLVLGTPHYGAPEQLAGKAVDCRADLYALGVVLYEIVVGKPPFDAPSLYELLGLIQTTDAPLPTSLMPDLPAAFDDFITKALAKTPERRFANASEMAKALQAFLTSTPVEQLRPSLRRNPAVASTLMQVPAMTVAATTPAELVAAVVRQWPAQALGSQEVGRLIDRLLEKPLHAAAFCGAADLGGTVLLICDGVLLDAVAPGTGETGDRALAALQGKVEATLYGCPTSTAPRLVALLASLIAPVSASLTELDAGLVDIPQLSGKLAREGFDGVIRFSSGPQLGFALFSKGARVLDVFGGGWPEDPSAQRWEHWIADSGATVSVEDRTTAYPAMTFRRQLSELCLEVKRAVATSADSILADTRAEAQALELVPQQNSSRDLPAGSTFLSLVQGDPIVGDIRWLLVDVPHQFTQYRRTNRWRQMIEPIASITTVTLHHTIALPSGESIYFDATTYAATDRPLHVMERVADGSPETVASFITRVKNAVEFSGAYAGVTGAVLIAPSFSETALQAYLDLLAKSRKGSIRSALELLTHREGYLSTAHGGCHVLLVEESSGRRRPLMPQS